MSDTSAPVLAFYDFDGTLASSNVVTRCAYFARRHPSKLAAGWRFAKLLAGVPLWIGLDLCSRRLFNEVFYRQYRGLRRDWLERQAEEMFEQEIRPKIYPGARDLVERDRKAGCRLVLVSGGLDFALAPAARYFGFDDLISNRLVFREGAATGEVIPPLLAEKQKVEAIRRFCAQYNVGTNRAKAYSDSLSDRPMLEAVGHPAAVNPSRGLRRAAEQRGWPILDLKGSPDGRQS